MVLALQITIRRMMGTFNTRLQGLRQGRLGALFGSFLKMQRPVVASQLGSNLAHWWAGVSLKPCMGNGRRGLSNETVSHQFPKDLRLTRAVDFIPLTNETGIDVYGTWFEGIELLHHRRRGRKEQRHCYARGQNGGSDNLPCLAASGIHQT